MQPGPQKSDSMTELKPRDRQPRDQCQGEHDEVRRGIVQGTAFDAERISRLTYLCLMIDCL
jgi:hypothetical protein